MSDSGIKLEVTTVFSFLKKTVYVKFILLDSRGKNKNGKLHTHFKSDARSPSLNRYLNFRNRRNNTDYMVVTNMRQQLQLKIEVAKSNQNAVKILINCTRYVSRQNLVFREHTDEDSNYFQLMYLMFKYGPIVS